MNVLDYSRSFVTFVTAGRGNNARLQIESRCVITDTKTGAEEPYYFFASCKSERTYAERDLFQDPNYDFCGIFSREEYVIFRAHAEWRPGYAERGLWRKRFENLLWHLQDAPRPRILETPQEIVQATLDGHSLVGRTEITSRDGALKALLEFPVKTMNVNDIRNIYQVDTGPLPFPLLDLPAERHIERMELAFVAYNVPGFADFVIQQETRIGPDSARSVPHYSNILSLPSTNAVIQVRA